MADEVTLGAVTVDLWTGKVSTGAALRPLELRLLRLLVAHAGAAVSVDTILVEVFDYAPGSRSKTLYTTMYRLRAALEADPARPRYLLAERGGGYVLHVDAPAVPRSNVEAPLDRFVDRPERAALEAALDAGERLVSLVGPGGSGRSRLALECAVRTCSAPVWRLAIGADERDVVVAAFARATGAAEPDVAAVATRLGQFGPCLCVIDEADRALDDVRAAVVAIRRAAPDARLVVTTREALGLPGEHRIEVGPLSEAAAVELLIARGGGYAQGIAPDRARALVDHLDRLALPIALAADQLSLLAADPLDRVDAAIAHSLDAALEPTWRRLTDDERRAVGRLSVLGCGFGPDVAAAALGSEPVDAAAQITRLHQRGLVASDRRAGGRPLSQLRTVRDRVRARVPSAVRRAALDGVAAHTVALAVEAFGDGEPPLSGRFDGGQDVDGVEAALRHAVDLGDDGAQVAEVALWVLVYESGRFALAEQGARAALAGSPAPPVRGQLLELLAAALYRLGRVDEAGAGWRAVVADEALPLPVRFSAGCRLAAWLGALAAWPERTALVDQLGAMLPPSPEGRDLARFADYAALMGEGAARAGDEDLAVSWFERAFEANRTAGQAVGAGLAAARIGASYARRQRILEAVASLRTAARFMPAEPRPRDAVAVAYTYGVLAEQALRSHLPDTESLIGQAGAAASRCAVEMSISVLSLRAECEILLGRADDAERTVADALVRGGRKLDVYRNAVHRVGALLQLAVGRKAEAEVLATRALEEAVGLDLTLWSTVRVLVEALVAQRRIALARDRLEAALVAARPGAVPPVDLLLHFAELAAWTSDPVAARWAVGIAVVADGAARERARALGAAAALAASARDGSAAELLDQAHGAAAGAHDLDGTLPAWLAVYAWRVAAASAGSALPSGLPEAPLYACVLRRAIDGCLGRSSP